MIGRQSASPNPRFLILVSTYYRSRFCTYLLHRHPEIPAPVPPCFLFSSGASDGQTGLDRFLSLVLTIAGFSGGGFRHSVIFFPFPVSVYIGHEVLIRQRSIKMFNGVSDRKVGWGVCSVRASGVGNDDRVRRPCLALLESSRGKPDIWQAVSRKNPSLLQDTDPASVRLA